MVMAAISALIVAAAAVVMFGYRMQGNIAAFIGAWFLTLVSMFSIGLMIASLCRTVKQMNVATTLVYFPMLFLSGATVPYEIFPAGLQKVADFMLLAQGIRLMKEASMGAGVGNLKGIAALIIITVLCTLVAVRTFRWE